MPGGLQSMLLNVGPYGLELLYLAVHDIPYLSYGITSQAFMSKKMHIRTGTREVRLVLPLSIHRQTDVFFLTNFFPLLT